VSIETSGPGRLLPKTTAFWIIACLYGMFLFASSAPSPLYVVYQAQWHFSASTLTVVFAVYVFALLAALVVTGSLSDRIGRHPTLLAAGAVQIAAMITFALADGVGWLALGRVLQGIATGIATGALSAWLLDLQPDNRPRLGATVGSIAPAAGLALGAIGAGLLVQYAPAPTRLVYWLLVAVFVAGLIAVLAIPETVVGVEPWWRALSPRIGIAGQSRAAFVAVTPLLVATWALSGLFLSLGGSLTAVVLHSRSHVVGGLVVLALTGVGVLATLATARFAPPVLMLGGAVALIVGVGVALIGLHQTSIELFFVGSCIAGVGFGPAWTGAFRIVVVTAPPSERAALVAAVFVVCYLAFSVPAIVVGIAVSHIGLLWATTWYGIGVMLLVAAAAAATLLRRVHAADTDRLNCPACPGTAAIHPSTRPGRRTEQK
jgi:MFS family permease